MTVRALALVVATVLASTACGGVTTGSGASEEEYVRANERLLEDLPEFPRAREVARSSSPYLAGDGSDSPPAGYTTNVVYELPRRVPQRTVVDFYVERLPDWMSAIEYAPGVEVSSGEARPGAWSVTLTRDGASVGVNTDNLIAPTGRRFEVAVDHRGASG